MATMELPAEDGPDRHCSESEKHSTRYESMCARSLRGRRRMVCSACVKIRPNGYGDAWCVSGFLASYLKQA